jgi:hypothetical protein
MSLEHMECAMQAPGFIAFTILAWFFLFALHVPGDCSDDGEPDNER